MRPLAATCSPKHLETLECVDLGLHDRHRLGLVGKKHCASEACHLHALQVQAVHQLEER